MNNFPNEWPFSKGYDGLSRAVILLKNLAQGASSNLFRSSMGQEEVVNIHIMFRQLNKIKRNE